MGGVASWLHPLGCDSRLCSLAVQHSKVSNVLKVGVLFVCFPHILFWKSWKSKAGLKKNQPNPIRTNKVIKKEPCLVSQNRFSLVISKGFISISIFPFVLELNLRFKVKSKCEAECNSSTPRSHGDLLVILKTFPHFFLSPKSKTFRNWSFALKYSGFDESTCYDGNSFWRMTSKHAQFSS